MTLYEQYMHRCIELARLGAGYTAPNPMVGAVLVCNGSIIGEGWHQQFGEAHAEVNCIEDAINKSNKDKLAHSTIFVSLEPCAHFGKTPPCSDLIIRHKIPEVVIGCSDPFDAVNGKGVDKLKAAGVQVVTGVLENECKALNKRFFTFHQQQRPYIILKWAETTDGFIAGTGKERLLISNTYTNRLVHKWRSEESAVLVGTNTALLDNPRLNVRLWEGRSPTRLVLDMDLRLPQELHLFDETVKTIVLNGIKSAKQGNTIYHKVDNNADIIPELLKALYGYNIQSVLVEGGTTLLQSFIDAGSWDEARVIKSGIIKAGDGLKAPVLKNYPVKEEIEIDTDTVSIIVNNKS